MNNTGIQSRNVSDHIFLCKPDTFRASKDYLQGGLCIRFIGIKSQDKNKTIDDDIETFIIDIDLWLFAGLRHGLPPARATRDFIYGFEENAEYAEQWYELHFDKNPAGLNYFYSTFSEEAPNFFDIKTLKSVVSPKLELSMQNSSPSQLQLNDDLASSGDWTELSRDAYVIRLQLEPAYFDGDFTLRSFHVGQGMCAIIHDDHWGMIFDMGAGKPVLRPDYPTPTNDLRRIASSLKSLSLLVSHFDSDHWRILAWDFELRKKIKHIYVPSGKRSTAFYDKEIKNKVVVMGDTTVALGRHTLLSIYRSVPSSPDSNGQCLVTTFHKKGNTALIPGDYAYHRFASDGNPGITGLLNHVYSAVIVPHHGDYASSLNVVDCVADSPAFFSAGTHQGYGHPTVYSVNEHLAKFFSVISDKTQTCIIQKTLL